VVSSPKVSVLMPTFNAEKYLALAVRSILKQTFKDFEFLIVDDGSTDQTTSIIEKFKDPRIRLVRRTHQGLVSTLNFGLRESRGEYLARMDADDISAPDRFKQQVRFLDNHPNYALVGTTIEAIDLEGRKVAVYPEPVESTDIVRGLTIRNVFSHGSIMARRKVLAEFGGYDQSARHAEDYDLWTKIARKYPVANLPDRLYFWRVNPTGVSLTKTGEQRKLSSKIADREWNYRIETNSLPQYSFEEVIKKRSNKDSDKYWPKRRSTVAGIHAQIANRLLLSHGRGRAWKEMLQALILSPRRARNYFYLSMFFLPKSVAASTEQMIKSLALHLRAMVVR
jgi:glycosyltransferase involved in cell wall biosynthesis